jgi:hypothetical protein
MKDKLQTHVLGAILLIDKIVNLLTNETYTEDTP